MVQYWKKDHASLDVFKIHLIISQKEKLTCKCHHQICTCCPGNKGRVPWIYGWGS